MLYTPPPEACSEEVKPKCAARPLPRASALRARLSPPTRALATRPRPACLRLSSRPPRPVSPPHAFPPRVPHAGRRPRMSSRVPLRSEREVHVVLDPLLGLKLRPHQREGVTVRSQGLSP